MPRPLTLAGFVSAGAVAALILGAVAAVAARAGALGALGPADWAALRFTLWQAALSALISCALAVPLSRALARRRFAGRAALLTLLGAPFLLPAIVAVLGLIAVWGRGGWLGAAIGAAGGEPPSIYGAHGVVLAHVFFNLPLATRLLLQGWLSIPAERFRVAAMLGTGPWRSFVLLELPMLRAVLPGAALLIFLICASSFAVALALGGGPRATTLELAIYQAVRFEFDLPRAATLALGQLGLTLLAGLALLRLTVPADLGAGEDRPPQRPDAPQGPARALDAAWIATGALFLVLPLLAIALKGLPGLVTLPGAVWASALRSALVAALATLLCLAMALPIAIAAGRGRRRGAFLELAALSGLAVSPLVIGTGLFLILFPLVDPAAVALPLTALLNAVAALPFAVRALTPALAQVEADYGRLADSLSLTGRHRLTRLILPRLRRPLGFSAGLAAALSMGDLGVVALFAEPGGATLPLHLYRLMAAYRSNDAEAAALLLLALSLLAFWLCDRGGRADAAV